MYMMAKWTIASARQHLPKLIASAAREPQRVYRRNKLVAAVVSPEAAETLERRSTVAKLFDDLQRICAEENYELPVAPRTNRPDPFAPTRKRQRR
jgi:hypothetical protein